MGNQHSSNSSYSSHSSKRSHSHSERENTSPGSKEGSKENKKKHISKSATKKILKAWAPPPGDGVPGEATRLAKSWVKAKNERNMIKLLQLAHPEACYRLPAEGICIPMRSFIEAIMELSDAFPDLEYKFADAAEPREGVAVLYEYYATGTHTGRGYNFQNKPIVPISNVKVLDGPVVKTITIKGGKIIDFLVYAPLGNTVGPLAFYNGAMEAHLAKKTQAMALEGQ
ncbi:MAG: hypothetical protein SGARI_003155 [Bacillariaceae sp.]